MSSKYPPIPALDGLRGFACLLVILFHAGYCHFVPFIPEIGFWGVLLFYVLSGFFMAYHYYPNGFQSRYWAAFWVHRFIRVYPAFFLVTFGYLIIPHLPGDFPLADGSGWKGLIPSWILCQQNGVFWTIPIEIKFYLFYPLIISSIFFLSFPVFLLTLGALLFSVCTGVMPVWTLNFFYYFLAGICSALLWKNSNLDRIRPVYWDLISIFLAGLSFYYFMMLKFHPSFFPKDRFYILGCCWPAPLLALGILSIGKSKGIIGWLFANPLSRFIGQISYSLYLVHWFVLNGDKQIFPGYLHNSFFVFGFLFLVAYFFYLLIERPCIRLGKGISQRILL